MPVDRATKAGARTLAAPWIALSKSSSSLIGAQRGRRPEPQQRRRWWAEAELRQRRRDELIGSVGQLRATGGRTEALDNLPVDRARRTGEEPRQRPRDLHSLPVADQVRATRAGVKPPACPVYSRFSQAMSPIAQRGPGSLPAMPFTAKSKLILLGNRATRAGTNPGSTVLGNQAGEPSRLRATRAGAEPRQRRRGRRTRAYDGIQTTVQLSRIIDDSGTKYWRG
jgi:hypothetical protein